MKSKGVLQPLVLATFLAVGFAVVWSLVGTWVTAIGEHVAQDAPRVERLILMPDGTPFVEVEDFGPYGGREYHDVDGHPVPKPPSDNAHWLRGTSLPATLPEPTGDIVWGQRVRSFADGRSPAGFWYFVWDGRADGFGYFVGYDSRSHACLGYLGTRGFRANSVPAGERIPFTGALSGPASRVLSTEAQRDPTEHPDPRAAGQAPGGPVSTWDIYVLARDGRIYHADLQQRTVEVVWNGSPVLSAALVPGAHDPQRGTPYHLAVRTADSVLVFDEHGGGLEDYSIPEVLRGREFAFAGTGIGEAVMYWHSPFDSLASEVEYRICWVGSDGRSRTSAITLPHAGGMRSLPVTAGLVMPGPLVLGGYLGSLRTGELLHEGLAETYPKALARALAEFWPALVIAQALALGLAVPCYRRQVRYGAGGVERLVWPLFVLALGLPGWVGYRFGRSWPVLEACPACTADVPRDRAACARCAASFPRPALKGTEVFA
jgi:hypothetical protein